jgi:hypothetical protein
VLWGVTRPSLRAFGPGAQSSASIGFGWARLQPRYRVFSPHEILFHPTAPATSFPIQRMPNLLPMYQFEVVTSGVDRSDGHVQPTQFEATLIGNTPVCFPDDPDRCMPKVSHFGFTRPSIKWPVHESARYGCPVHSTRAMEKKL